MNPAYTEEALMAFFKKHQISRRTAVIGGAVVVVAGASAAYLALPGSREDQPAPAPSTPSTPTAPSTPSVPSTPSAPAPTPAPAPSPSTQEPRKLVVALSEDMPSLSPLAYPPGGAGPHRTTANYMENLMYQNRDVAQFGGVPKFLPILAATVDSVRTVEPGDFTRIRITLRKGVKFHSGDPLTSESLSGDFSFRKVYDESNWRFYFGRTQDEIVDDLTADIIFSRPSISNLTTLRHSGRPFLWNPRHLEKIGLENVGGPDQDGTGPYKLKEWQPGVRIVMEKNRNYWADTIPEAANPLWSGQSGNVDEVTFVFIKEPAAQVTALQAGDIDVIVETPLTAMSTLERDPNITVSSSGGGNLYIIYLNTLVTELSDTRVRQAIQHSVDALALRKLFDDRNPVAQGLFLPWMLGFDKDIKGWKPVNLGKAKQFLAESGYKDGFDMVMSPDSRRENSLMGQALAPMISKTGINVTLKVYEPSAWGQLTNDRENTSLPIYPLTIGYQTESIDYFNFFYGSRRRRAGMDVPFLAGYGRLMPDGSPRSGRPDFGLMGSVSTLSNPAERAKIYKVMAQYVVDEALQIVPLYSIRAASMSKRILSPENSFWKGNGNFNVYRTTLP